MPWSLILVGTVWAGLKFFLCLQGPVFSGVEAYAKPGKDPFVVVIDPGHGGSDHGATVKKGQSTIYEKDIALGIAIRLAKVLKDPKYWRPLGRPIKVVLTREKDIEVSLEARSERAKALKADLFLSIHTNSDPSGKARGIETYFLNNTDDKSSSKLEEIENKMSKKYASAPPNSLLIRSIAADAVVDSSKLAAENIHSSAVLNLKKEDIKVSDRGVKQALLYVLLDAQVPGVLFEAFFLSHPKDLDLVTQGEVRQALAEGIAKGVLRFLVML